MRKPRTYYVQMTDADSSPGYKRTDAGIVEVTARYAFEALERAEKGRPGQRAHYVVGDETEVRDG